MQAPKRSSKKKVPSRSAGKKSGTPPSGQAKGRQDRRARDRKAAGRSPRSAGTTGRTSRSAGVGGRASRAAGVGKRASRSAGAGGAGAPKSLRRDNSAARVRELESRILELERELAAARRAGSPSFLDEPFRAHPAGEASPRSEPFPEAPAEEPDADTEALFESHPLEPDAEEEPLGYEEYDEQEDFLASSSSMDSRRREIDRERSDREMEFGDEPFWMVCPKCGEHLSEHEYDHIRIEHCSACGGIWMDRAESDLLLLFSEEDRTLAYRVRGLLH